jgi:hypothetical protein
MYDGWLIVSIHSSLWVNQVYFISGIPQHQLTEHYSTFALDFPAHLLPPNYQQLQAEIYRIWHQSFNQALGLVSYQDRPRVDGLV